MRPSLLWQAGSMATGPWPYPFRPTPWEDIARFLGRLAETHDEFGHMAAVADSVVASGSTDRLAGCTSMHDILVVSTPVREPPYDLVVVRAPSSLRPPRAGCVLIEHLTGTGRNDKIERPTADAVPLFWRFMIEKFGVYPAAGAQGNDD